MLVTPDGEIRRLDLTMMAGAAGVSEVDHVEEFRELDLSLEEYVASAESGIDALTAELAQRNGRS